jgi:chromosome segregation ATPase
MLEPHLLGEAYVNLAEGRGPDGRAPALGRLRYPAECWELVAIVDLQEQLGKLEDDLKTTQGGIDTLFRDQDRLRENLKALRETSEDQLLRSRYLDQLKRQEDRIDTSRAHIESVNRERATAQATLSDLISNLSFEN